jgi:thioredoxin 1
MVADAATPESTMARGQRTRYAAAMPMHDDADRIPTVTGDTFDADVLGAAGPIAVEFMSYGCAHCRAMEPVLQAVAADVRGRERVVRVNVGTDQELASTYAIAGTPTFVMFRDAREVGRVEGPHPTRASVLHAITQPFAA